MKKLLTGIALTAMFVLPLAASASTNIQTLTVNGKINDTVQKDSDVDTIVRVTLTNPSEIECISYEVVGSGFGAQPVDVEDQVNTGLYDFPITIAGQNLHYPGTYNVTYRVYGTSGSGTDQNCTGPVNDTMTFNGRITVQNDAVVVSSSSTGSSSSMMPKWFTDWWNSQHPATAPAPTPIVSAVCTAYAQANAGTQTNTYNDANVRLQGFLLSQGASIPALKAGASFGFYGNQTTAAVGWFQSMNHCQ